MKTFSILSVLGLITAAFATGYDWNSTASISDGWVTTTVTTDFYTTGKCFPLELGPSTDHCSLPLFYQGHHGQQDLHCH